MTENTNFIHSMKKSRVYADFHNADAKGRLRLNCDGTVEDLACQKITLRESQHIVLYNEELEVDGIVKYSNEEELWVAAIDWNAIREIDLDGSQQFITTKHI